MTQTPAQEAHASQYSAQYKTAVTGITNIYVLLNKYITYRPAQALLSQTFQIISQRSPQTAIWLLEVKSRKIAKYKLKKPNQH